MSRLVVFGCSLAYGVGLPDCWPNTAAPSNFCWPKIIADSMNRKLINKSIPGASNKLIWHTLNNFKFQTDDVVIISWSYTTRNSILKSKHIAHHLHHNLIDTDSASAAFYKELFSHYDCRVMSKLFADSANKLLDEINIPVYNLVVEKHYRYMTTRALPLYMSIYEESYTKALDQDHLGLDGHRAFAADFMDHIGIVHNLKNIPKPYSLFKQLKNLLCK